MLPLGLDYYGPNINYDVKNIEDERRFLSDKKVGASKIGDVYIDQIHDISVTLENEGDKNWIFTEILPTLNDKAGGFYSVHQDSKNKVYVYRCEPDVLNIDEVFCGPPAGEFQLFSAISAVSHGEFCG